MDGVDGAEWLYAIMTDLACTDRELDAAVALLTGTIPRHDARSGSPGWKGWDT